MKIKSILLLAVALGCGLVAMLGVQQALSGKKKDSEGTTRVLFATTEINPGMRLTETNVVFKDWSSDWIPPGAVTSPEEIEDRALMARALPGEILLIAELGAKGQIGASTEIPEGMRLATVSVNLTKIHSGLIMPGDHVDLVLTYKTRLPGQQEQSTITRTVLENVEIFATDSKRTSDVTESDGTQVKAKNISLLVSPEQYHMCMHAESKGQLTLALRNSKDTELLNNSMAVDDKVFEQGLNAPGTNNSASNFLEKMNTEEGSTTIVAVPEPATWKIKIYEGDQARIEEVELPEEEGTEEETLKTTTLSPQNSENDKKLKTWIKTFLTGVETPANDEL